MNGPTSMYRLPQIVHHDFQVQLPTCMYKLKNIHGPPAPESSTTTRNSSVVPIHDVPSTTTRITEQNSQSQGMAALEARQDQILQQLAELKKQMGTIRKQLNVDNKPVPKVTSRPSVTFKASDIPDLIVNASPSHPPYSLLLIQKLWQSHTHLVVKTYIHSSIDLLSENAQDFKRIVESFIPKTAGDIPKVNIRLIWKDVGSNTELMVSQLPILGESNILRYLARFSDNAFNYELNSNVNNIDFILDKAHSIVKAKHKTERAQLLQALHKSLEKSQWMAGSSHITIADMAAYSAIKQTAGSGEVNVNLQKWQQRCETV